MPRTYFKNRFIHDRFPDASAQVSSWSSKFCRLGPPNFEWRFEIRYTPSNSSVQSGVILWRNPLSIGFFTQFDAFQTVIPAQQVLNLSHRILRRVVQDAYRNEDWHVVGKLAAQNKIQSGLLCVVIDVFSAMPRIVDDM